MAGKYITLKFDGKCADCGAALPAGTRARWYGRGRVYGLTCHEKSGVRRAPRALDSGDLERMSPGAVASHYDPRGAYAVDGTYLGTVGRRCEDAPCCGCCD